MVLKNQKRTSHLTGSFGSSLLWDKALPSVDPFQELIEEGDDEADYSDVLEQFEQSEGAAASFPVFVVFHASGRIACAELTVGLIPVRGVAGNGQRETCDDDACDDQDDQDASECGECRFHGITFR